MVFATEASQRGRNIPRRYGLLHIKDKIFCMQHYYNDSFTEYC